MHLTQLKGFGTSGSLIVAIGAQNAFVIRQGMLRRHLFMTAFLCSVIDALLILLFGSIASQQPPDQQIYFTLGAISASFLWFFAITYGSYLLAPFLSKQSSWRIIDGLIALTMWGIAVSLMITL